MKGGCKRKKGRWDLLVLIKQQVVIFSLWCGTAFRIFNLWILWDTSQRAHQTYKPMLTCKGNLIHPLHSIILIIEY